VRKTMVYLLLAMLAVAAYSVRATIALESQSTKAAAPKQGRWHGVIIRWVKDTSTVTVRKGNNDRQIHYDTSTKWTQGTKGAEVSDFKEGSDVICIGTFDEKGRFIATRIDLQPR